MKSIKTTLAAVLMGWVATPALATEVSDTLVIEDVNKVKIETQDTVQRIVINGSKDDPEFHYVQRISIPDSHAVRRTIRSVRDFNRITIKKNGKPTKWTSTGHLNIGLGTMLDAPDNYKFKVWPSFELGIGLTHDWHPFGKQNEWSIGYGIDWRSYRSDNDTYWTKEGDLLTLTTPYAAKQSETETGLNMFSLQFPLLYTHYFDKHRDWAITLGAIVNWNVYATATREYEENDEEYDVSTKKIGQRPFTVDAYLKITNPVIPIYCKYSPMTFFKDGRGPKMHQLNFGICF